MTSIPITNVTVLEDRASITRRGNVHLPAGQSRLEVERVSPVLADKTLFASASNAKILDVRCERRVVAWVDRDGGIAKLDAERAALVDGMRAISARIEAARAESSGVAELLEASLRELAVAAARGQTSPQANVQLAELDALDAAARVRLVDAEAELRDRDRALARLDATIARAKNHAGDEVAMLVVDVIAETATDATITIGYVVPGAAWRPYHRATLAKTDSTTGKIDWQTTACVWQSTGEDWVGADITFSLERASLGVEPPELAEDELRTRRKPDSVTVESREHDHQTTGLGGESTPGAPEVPGIDDGGLGLTLSATKVDVKSDGTPHRVDVSAFTAPVQLSLVAIPLRSTSVHLRARIVNAGSAPLLAGPVDLILHAGLVGRAEIGFVAAGEKFYVGYGPEADVRVHRSETRERDEAGLLGGWNVQTIKVAVRLSNLGAQRREVVVTERIPISEVEQVEIQLGAPDAYLLADDEQPGGGEEITQVTARAMDNEKGLVSWAVELPPLGRRAVTLEYRVRSQRGVAGV